MKLSRDFRIFAAIPAKAGHFLVGWKEIGGKFESTEATLDNSSDNSIEYYREREQHERNLAESAASPAIQKIHMEMADSYRTLIALLSGPQAVRANEGRREEPPLSLT